MKTVIIEKDEVVIAEKIVELYNFEIINGLVCNNGLAIVINGRIIKMIKEGLNNIGVNESLFRATKSKLLADYLLQELYFIDDDISIYKLEKETETVIKIYDSDHNLLSIYESKNSTESIIMSIFKFYLGDELKDYSHMMNFSKIQ